MPFIHPFLRFHFPAVRSRLQTAEDTHHLANDLPKFPQKSHHLSNDNGVATLTGQPIFEPFLQTGSSKVLEDIVRLKVKFSLGISINSIHLGSYSYSRKGNPIV